MGKTWFDRRRWGSKAQTALDSSNGTAATVDFRAKLQLWSTSYEAPVKQNAPDDRKDSPRNCLIGLSFVMGYNIACPCEHDMLLQQLGLCCNLLRGHPAVIAASEQSAGRTLVWEER